MNHSPFSTGDLPANPVRWLAVHTLAKAEKLAAGEIAAAGIRVWAPAIRVSYWRRRSQRRVVAIRPLFSRYVFAAPRADSLAAGVHLVNEAKGVACVLHNAGVPQIIPGGVMAALMALCDQDGLLIEGKDKSGRPDPGVALGERVRLEGTTPWAGLVGEVRSLAKFDSTGQIGLWIDAFGGRLKVSVPADLIGKKG